MNQPVQRKIAFTSKADVLNALQPLNELNIPKSYSFTQAHWLEGREEILHGIFSRFPGLPLAIRSSCLREDSSEYSGAGAFLSVLNVNSSDSEAVRSAIEQVIASYGEADPNDQVLVQEMVKNPAVTGVIMTRSLQDGTPYYVINYDDESGRTDTITGGANVSKTVYIYREAHESDFDSPRLKSFVNLAKRLEEICGRSDLDIEFCLDADNVLHLLQARPICSQANWPQNPDVVRDYIAHVSQFIKAKTGCSTSLHGRNSILGVMPDWNPAEMIGIQPRPLDISLYRDLITSRVWSAARARMGYNPVAATELMLVCAGRPYIDVRASFNSFLPADLDPVTGEALVSAWLERLDANPQLHDKIEFEIAQTALDFCFDEQLDSRYPGLLTGSRRADFKRRLLNLTSACISGPGLDAAMERIIELRARHAGRPLNTPKLALPITRINDLLAECRKYGTLPFSILARHAFIAESLLKTAAARGAIARERIQAFKRSVRTVSGELSSDFMAVCNGLRDSGSFIAKYGHLRPGSYDILSPRYADRENLFSGKGSLAGNASLSAPEFELGGGERKSINALLADSGLPGNADALLEYAGKAIAGRELAKFVFSRNLSDILEITAQWAADLDLSREDAAFLPIQAILEQGYSIGVESPKSYFAELSAKNRAEYEQCRRIKLGYLIRSARDVYIVPQHRAAPNFVGAARTEAELARLYADSSCAADIAGKIVCIENADPGFDWIFTRGIAGLVTKFGGANSHMAIRCAEYGLPAAIGIGEKLFADICEAQALALDPANSILKPLED